MKKYILAFISLLFLTLFSISLYFKLTYKPFDTDNVLNNIKELSSSIYEGRLAGSEGNIKTSEYIINELKNNSIDSYNDAYREMFKVKAPKLINGSPSLILKSPGGNVYKEFKYGVDFKEDLLNFKENTFSFGEKFRDSKLYIFTQSIVIQNSQGSFMLYVSDNSSDFRSSFLYNSPCSMYISITKEVYDEILDKLGEDYTLDCFIPMEVVDTNIPNIVGKIKGRDSSLPPLILSAHFDHLGIDLGGNLYSGALDNASGISFLLELSKNLASLPKPDRDIIILALNGEEFGLLGSQDFATNNLDSIKDSKLINFDMVASTKDTSLSIFSGKYVRNSKLIEDLSNILENDKIYYVKKFEDVSDHAPFNSLGIDGVTLGFEDYSNIHTPNDTYEYTSSHGINLTYDLVYKYILSNYYGGFTFTIYDSRLFYGSLGLFLIFSCLSLYLIYKDLKTKKLNK
ncbi:M28 family metallopeptidase [Clostridium intestinale]|uniref:M28 family metallopeptidase n=1 Tax=Clostridium intestinale TaxID=36845 RepID=UPI002DD6624D|nr:M28 family metallopeptidase [Clostridium intestinale]WRY49844.1 M28 family metallopeptidase [Clostridium intestinale]